jgi:hypothetical protein
MGIFEAGFRTDYLSITFHTISISMILFICNVIKDNTLQLTWTQLEFVAIVTPKFRNINLVIVFSQLTGILFIFLI